MGRRALALAWLLSTVGCVWDTATVDGYQCDPQGRCLDGYSCVGGRCIPEGSDAGSLIDGGAATDAARDASQTDSSSLDQADTDVAQPDSSRTDVGLTDSPQPDVLLADVGAPDASTPDVSRADTSAPDTSTPDTSAPDTSAPDTSAPDTSAPDTNLPDSARPDTNRPDTSLPDACTPPPGPSWWGLDYEYRFQLDVEAAPEDYTVYLSLSGAEAAAVFGYSEAGGDDVRLVHHGGATRELDRELYSFSATSIRLRFSVQESGGYGGGTGTYYLYVGNPAPAAPLDDLHNVYYFFEDFEGFAHGSDASPVFITDPAASWTVVHESGNHAFQAEGDARRVAQIAGLNLTDLRIEAQVRFTGSGGSDHAAIAFRATDLTAANVTCYQGEMRRSVGDLGISEYTAGARGAQLANAAQTINTDQWYELEVTAVGGDVDVRLDTNTPVSATGVAPLGDQIGLYAIFAGVQFDDVRVRLREDPSPGADLGVEQQPCM